MLLLSPEQEPAHTSRCTDDLMAGAFRDAFEEMDRRIFYELLEVFDSLSQRYNVTYSLFYGSLFGQHCVGDQLA